jgi:hypothetical protein
MLATCIPATIPPHAVKLKMAVEATSHRIWNEDKRYLELGLGAGWRSNSS